MESKEYDQNEVKQSQSIPLTNQNETVATSEQETSEQEIHLRISSNNLPNEISSGIEKLAKYSVRKNIIFTNDNVFAPAFDKIKNVWQWNLKFIKNEQLPFKSLKIIPNSQSFMMDPLKPFIIEIHFTRPCEAFRGLGSLLGILQNKNKQDILSNLETFEISNFNQLGLMIDCSRNAVLSIKTIKFLLNKLALMGFNMIQLYCEDTYEIPDEPFFGYLRGGFTFSKMKEIDDYAFDLGIECIPCIQTLGHLGQMLQWPKFMHLRDTLEILLVDAPETYLMLRKMIQSATKPFRSNKIHLGMDETHGLGQGRYQNLFKYKDSNKIFIDHLIKVTSICNELQLKGCIWSDMLFCLNAKNNSLIGYYDSKFTTLQNGIPNNIELVYWDYYHTSKESFISRIQSHFLLDQKKPTMASGIWSWSRMWTNLPFSFLTMKASMNACKMSNLEKVFACSWGDEGNECDIISILPALSYYAEHCYTRKEEIDFKKLKNLFDGICGGSFDDFVFASNLDDFEKQQTIDDLIHFASNSSKWLLWEDPVMSFVSQSIDQEKWQIHYEFLANYLENKISKENCKKFPLNARLKFPALIARVLSFKCGLRKQLHEAYINKDWNLLNDLANYQNKSRLTKLRNSLENLANYHRQMWMSTYEPNGFEIIDLRYGGLIQRFDTLQKRINQFLRYINSSNNNINKNGIKNDDDELIMLDSEAGSNYNQFITSLPELEQKLLTVYGNSEQLLDYHRVSRVTYC